MLTFTLRFLLSLYSLDDDACEALHNAESWFIETGRCEGDYCDDQAAEDTLQVLGEACRTARDYQAGHPF